MGVKSNPKRGDVAELEVKLNSSILMIPQRNIIILVLSRDAKLVQKSERCNCATVATRSDLCGESMRKTPSS